MSEDNKAEAWAAKGLWQYTACAAIAGAPDLTVSYVGPAGLTLREEVVTDGQRITLRLMDGDRLCAERSVHRVARP